MVTDTSSELGRPPQGWRRRMHEVIFQSETPAGRAFDKVIIAVIIVSVAVVIADSVQSLNRRYRLAFDIAEWCFTALFTLEYIARILSVQRPLRYMRSFFGIVDLLSVLPTYLAIFFPEAQALIDVRILRLLRIFRIFKLADYVAEYQMLGDALAASRRKILVFLSAVLMVVLIVGTLLYVVEGPQHGFKDIPTSVYWAITTITTVGFGDLTPKTELGRFIASIMMLIGWGTLAVPTGIVTAEIAVRRRGDLPAPRTCHACGAPAASPQARFCEMCGAPLSTAAADAS
ncbi:ion transporter [Caenimonas aquaedulcis]|uniref:Ion transporter n=1 Tax=Caenimonas aquaedulcis TaxID=2793270 RepID=A0A931H4L5_9BURK|nr:ion transporter [Caenimonas aquaedulcis]MBG9388438.1 ion transporter [Caenimonas aquaedulcis]